MKARKRARASHIWKRDKLDWYREPSWCAERFFEVEAFRGPIHDPFCGVGTIVNAARTKRRGCKATGADIVRRARGFDVCDFFEDSRKWANIVSNPPYRYSDDMLLRVLARAHRKVALLLPFTWFASADRARLLRQTPLRTVWVLVPRPSMPPGEYIAAGKKPKGGRVDFAWFVWNNQVRYGRPEIRHLCREATP